MTSLPLDSTHGRTKLGMTCHHRPCTARMVGRRQAWHDITALEKHNLTNDVMHGMTSPPLDRTHGRQRRAWHDNTALGQHTQSNDVRRGMTSPPLDRTHCRTTSRVACHHRIWAAHTVERRRTWHVIITCGQHKRLNDVGRGMKSSPLDCTEGRMTLGVA